MLLVTVDLFQPFLRADRFVLMTYTGSSNCGLISVVSTSSTAVELESSISFTSGLEGTSSGKEPDMCTSLGGGLWG
jgi:hypothetical protein